MTFQTTTQVQSFDWQKLLFSFEGRTRRSHFWIGWLICLGVGVVTGWIPLLGGLISLLLIWPNLAITVKRLHDMGYTGWLAAIPWVVGIFGAVIGIFMIGATAVFNSAALDREEPMAVFALASQALGVFGVIFLVCVGFLLWIGITDGQRGPNRFGPDPKESAIEPTFTG